MNEISQRPMAWRYCGSQIRLWRTQAGVTREQLGEAASYALDTVKSMETGRRRPTVQLLRTADELCGAHGLLMAAQDYLKPEPFPARAQEFIQYEADAVALHSHEPLLIPGLLQTEPYARALISNSCPPLDKETIDERVSGRLERQKKLFRQPLTLFSFVIYEAALRTGVGGRAVMKDQLLRLLTVGEQCNVSIQVLPVDHAAWQALSGALVLLETPEHEHLAYVAGQVTSMLLSEPAEVNVIAERYGIIRMQALSAEESARFISDVAEEL